LIENCHARNTGDDAFAIWSATDGYPAPCTGNIIRNCTAELPWRANCYGVYGGRGNHIENCVGIDAICYPGLTISTDFSPYPLDSVTVDSLTLIRCGGHYFVGYPYENDFGAIWLLGVQPANNGIKVMNADVIDPTYSGILLQGAGTFNNTIFQNITISNPVTDGVEIRAEVNGDATLKNINMVSNSYGVPRIVNESTKLKLTDLTPVQQPWKSISSRNAIRVIRGKHPALLLDLPARRDGGDYCVRASLYLVNGTTVAELLDKKLSSGVYRITLESAVKNQGGVYLAAVTIDGVTSRCEIIVH
jgi:hypothetical protein